MKNLYIRALLLLFTLLIISGCAKKPKLDIAVSQCSGGEWRETMNNEMKREVLFNDDFDINLNITDACDNVQKQIEDLRKLAATRPDVLLVAPAVADSLADVISEIHDSGIPVIVFDRDVPGASYTAFIGADNTEIGRQAARYARANINGHIYALEITGDMNSTPAQQRAEGFRTMADSLPDFTIVGSYDAMWRAETSQIITDSVLRLHPEINMIFGHNDPTAELAAAAADSLGMRGHILVTGVDGAPSFGLRMLEGGRIDASILYPTLGHETMNLAIDAALNKDISPRYNIKDLPAIDKSNVVLYLTHYRTLLNETGKIVDIKNTFDKVYQQHNIQSALLWAAIAIVLLLSALLIYIWRSYKERKLLHARLEAATKAKVAFFTNVSHDLRTPLTMIGTAIDRIGEHASLDASDSSLLRLARKNSRILTRLINQILDFNKYENEQLTLRLSNTDIHEFIEEMKQIFSSAITSRGIVFKVDNAIPYGMHSAIDVEKTERILFNILSNAMKFTPPNGSITLSASICESDIRFSINDTGRGMTDDELSGLFERFRHSRESNYNGSGIGMSIAKAFVDLQGGTIQASSKLGTGTQIIFSLPVRSADTATGTGDDAIRLDRDSAEEELNDIDMQTATEPDCNESMILVVDDNPDIRALLTNILGNEYRVLRASSGTQGIKMASRYIPDAIICDIMMPDIDGLEVCRRLKNETATSHIPVIMLTACSNDRKRIESYNSGADAYLNKPFDKDTLTALIASILENRQRAQKSRIGALSASVPPGKTTDDALAPNTDVDNEFYRRLLEVLEPNIGNSALSIDDLSELMHMDRTQLYRKIKATTNCAPSELVRMIRLKKARHLLPTTEMPVKDIAAATGFASHAYFTKCFRMFFGETPANAQRRTSKIK